MTSATLLGHRESLPHLVRGFSLGLAFSARKRLTLDATSADLFITYVQQRPWLVPQSDAPGLPCLRSLSLNLL